MQQRPLRGLGALITAACWSGALSAQAAPPPSHPSQPAASQTTQLTPVATSATALSTEVNQANQAELEMVPGIGPQLSEQILALRASRLFADWPDLIARLKGVGPARAAKLSAAGLRVGGQSYAPTINPGASRPSAQASATAR